MQTTDHNDRHIEWPTDSQLATPETTAIVTVNYNTKRLVAELIWSVYRTLGESGFAKLLVIDNGSSDSSPQLLHELAKENLVELIANDENLYHGPALNQAFDHLAQQQRHGDRLVSAIWVLDSDCVVLRGDVLIDAEQVMASTDAALVGQPQFDQWHSGDLGVHSLLVDPALIWRDGITSFQEHGEPSKVLQETCATAGLVASPIGFTRDGYVIHRGRGTLAAIAEVDQQDNRYFDWAAGHSRAHWAGEDGAEHKYAAFERDFAAAVPELTPAALAKACRSAHTQPGSLDS